MELFKKLPLEQQAYLKTIFQNCTEYAKKLEDYLNGYSDTHHRT